ncbi:homoserine kinase [Asaccharospora irregularis]|uniref:Homoserine kinase n=1 Tax=Asaccharospora irregularis DSM 2635 TaxID=1121321 RepID=A0A1M5KL96_9FIRM|nr:homoserine kinase [Asaccharospora irregularis]SHG53460.1 homoserine kinase [Asaccharospora irregularis DSM 2635]
MLEIIVPATSANIGPGFDCLGIALNIYNKFYIEEIDNGLQIEGCEPEFRNENNLIYKSMKYFFSKVNPSKTPKGIKIKIETNIPVCRGLGSSATCIVAGVMAANYLSNSHLSKDELLEIASEIEGHPDNVAPALFGNMITSISEKNKIYYDVIKVPKNLKFCAMIPDFRLSTEKSRGVLPSTISYSDGVYNVGRVSLLITAIINENFELIKVACKDKLHQNYRGSLIKNYEDIVDKADKLGALAVFLSGAGPTIMALIKEDDNKFLEDMSYFLSPLKSNWKLKELSCDVSGAILNVIN